jgi:cytochrome c
MTHRLGPDLHDIVGRPIGSAAGFNEYSAALKAQRGDWTAEKLDAFLRNPQKAIPGNAMGFAGVPDGAQRAKLIEYLKESRRQAVNSARK